MNPPANFPFDLPEARLVLASDHITIVETLEMCDEMGKWIKAVLDWFLPGLVVTFRGRRGSFGARGGLTLRDENRTLQYNSS
jgi:hypothetical protein